MPEYSIIDSSAPDTWVKVIEPLETTTDADEVWFSTDEQEAIDEAVKLTSQTSPGRFASGPRPIKH